MNGDTRVGKDFHVCVFNGEHVGWMILVKEKDGSDFANVTAPDLDLALQMALPYMASIATEHPFMEKVAKLRSVPAAETDGAA